MASGVIILAGGAIPKPTGDLYNAGTWNDDVPHGLYSYSLAYAGESSGYISINSAGGGAQRAGGAIFGPLVIGNGYSAAFRGPTNDADCDIVIWVTTNRNNFYPYRYPVSGTGYKSEESNVGRNATKSLSINCSNLAGQIGYVIVVCSFPGFKDPRTDCRITSVSAS